MEKNFNTDNFEQMLREATDDFRMYPSRKVWHGIYNDLHPDKKWPSFAILLLLVTSIMYIGVTNSNKGGQPLAEISSDANEKPIQSASGLLDSEGSKISSTLAVTPVRSNITAKSGNRTYQRVNQGEETGSSVANDQTIDARRSHTGIVLTSGISGMQSDFALDNGRRVENTLSTYDVLTSTKKQIDNEGVNTTVSVRQENDLITYTSPLQKNTPGVDPSSILPATSSKLLISKLATTPSPGSGKVIKVAFAPTKDQSGWMEDYAFHNLKLRDKWKGRMSYQVYVTPSLGYRKLNKNKDYSPPPTNALITNPYAPVTTNYSLNHASAINLEIGTGIIYSASKLLRLKAGVQMNYTNYSVKAQELNHPTFTSLMLTNDLTNRPVLSTRTTTIANTSGTASTYLNNNTYQISVPLGADLKVAGTERLKLYLGATLQPTYILGSQSYLISADMKNYVAEESFVRQYNLNGAVEAFVTYKTQSGVTINLGPQIRNQFFSTYEKKYNYDEKLYNIGVKIGMTKSF